ncbi:hypothetical protein C493_00860 [Natronolimnohabitans innermongolicus JCM 12255]|uniref:Uncharacterized protein n=1 Tax=Natronolimnohabitans innermongolicus JCM 12255 TaxID=1227499 RepID=L9XL51_9EURY|nr:hypothetical protein C493_00860 [Natronolimnohabitans innermongolicus JCM 12255]
MNEIERPGARLEQLREARDPTEDATRLPSIANPSGSLNGERQAVTPYPTASERCERAGRRLM